MRLYFGIAGWIIYIALIAVPLAYGAKPGTIYARPFSPDTITYLPSFAGKPGLLLADSHSSTVRIFRLSGQIEMEGNIVRIGHTNNRFLAPVKGAPLMVAGNSIFIQDKGKEPILYRMDAATRNIQAVNDMNIADTRTNNGAAALEAVPIPSGEIPLDVQAKTAGVGVGGRSLWQYPTSDKILAVLAGDGNVLSRDSAFPLNILAAPTGLTRLGGSLPDEQSDIPSFRLREGDRLQGINAPVPPDFFGIGGGREQGAMAYYTAPVYEDNTGIYSADSVHHTIRFYDTKRKLFTVLAGSGRQGFKDGTLSAAEFNKPLAIAKGEGIFYVLDSGNRAIRAIDPVKNTVTTLIVWGK